MTESQGPSSASEWLRHVRVDIAKKVWSSAEQQPPILRAPAPIRLISPDDFHPKVLHLGLHNRKPYSAGGEEFKVEVARALMREKNLTDWDAVVARVVKCPQDVRRQYEQTTGDWEDGYVEITEADDDAVAHMLTLDAIFVVAFLRNWVGRRVGLRNLSGWTEIFCGPRLRGLIEQMERDLTMLQNQVPMCCLKEAMGLILADGFEQCPVGEETRELESMLRHVVCRLYPFQHDSKNNDEMHQHIFGHKLADCAHLLDCLYCVVSENRYWRRSPRPTTMIPIERNDDVVTEDRASLDLSLSFRSQEGADETKGVALNYDDMVTAYGASGSGNLKIKGVVTEPGASSSGAETIFDTKQVEARNASIMREIMLSRESYYSFKKGVALNYDDMVTAYGASGSGNLKIKGVVTEPGAASSGAETIVDIEQVEARNATIMRDIMLSRESYYSFNEATYVDRLIEELSEVVAPGLPTFVRVPEAVVAAKDLIWCGVRIKSEPFPFKLSNIRFDKDKLGSSSLVLPRLVVSSSTATLLRNLAVYEFLSHPEAGEIRAYMRFMEDLVTDARDATYVIRSGAMINKLVGKDQIIVFWSRLNAGIPHTYPDRSVKVIEVGRAIRRFCRKRKYRSLLTLCCADIAGRVCRRPTLFFSFVIGLALLLLTAAQTYVSIVSASKLRP